DAGTRPRDRAEPPRCGASRIRIRACRPSRRLLRSLAEHGQGVSLEWVRLAALVEPLGGDEVPVAGVEHDLPLDARLMIGQDEGKSEVVRVEQDEEGGVPYGEALVVDL